MPFFFLSFLSDFLSVSSLFFELPPKTLFIKSDRGAVAAPPSVSSSASMPIFISIFASISFKPSGPPMLSIISFICSLIDSISSAPIPNFSNIWSTGASPNSLAQDKQYPSIDVFPPSTFVIYITAGLTPHFTHISIYFNNFLSN